MKKVLTIIHPFDRKQQVFVYDNGNKIDVSTPTLDELNNNLFELSEKYQITRLDFHGPKQYTQRLVEKFEEAELAKYNQKKLKCYIV